MSLSHFYYEPFYSIFDFNRLLDVAFNARAAGNPRTRGQVTQRGESNRNQTRTLRPRMDVHENSASNVVTATLELPGLKKEDVNIDVHNNVLTISGESKISSEHDENGYAVRERRFVRFERSIPLPQGIKSEDIKAGLDNGVLTVSFPKTTAEQASKKTIIPD
ncbi:small heat shock protein [Irpex rosettiformis]|uniref:Small heat shock protein n=1 Tax=Irpex rosettiformis TaxID=378272 RepID=A0ACB8UDD9_9APHY|nr:small heat shock protein [Irpex rosettiformis]